MIFSGGATAAHQTPEKEVMDSEVQDLLNELFPMKVITSSASVVFNTRCKLSVVQVFHLNKNYGLSEY